jgi:hypothetical protein
LSDSEKLLIYYSFNLYLLKDDVVAYKLSEKFAANFDVKGSPLFEANMHRILALL